MSNIADEFARMPAGKEMDEAIAKHVMKWRPDSESERWITGRGEPTFLPNFSTDCAFLKEMESKLRALGWGFQWEQCVEEGYGADFFKKGQRIVGYADTRALAFCRAALRVWPFRRRDPPMNHFRRIGSPHF